MPLMCTEEVAVNLATKKITANQGDVAGVKSYLRGIGAHSEQAKRLTERAYAVWEESQGLPQPEEEPRQVSVSVETSEGELNVLLKSDRLPITTLEELVDFYNIDTDVWTASGTTFNFWGSKSNPNFQVKARFTKDKYAEVAKFDREGFVDWATGYAPDWSPVQPSQPAPTQYNMVELVLSDLHVGKNVNDEDWLQLVEDSAFYLLQQCQDYSPAEVNIVLLGDTFNSEGRRRTTTNGTGQEDSLDWRNTFSRTREFVVDVVSHATSMHDCPVNVFVIPGNHDYELSYYLNDTLHAYYAKHPNVNVPLLKTPRTYIEWGTTLVGLTHGDSLKPSDMPLLMLREVGTRHYESFQWHLGHFHTRKEDEIQGVTLRYFGTPSKQGEWDMTKGYGNNRKELVAMVFDKRDGEIATLRQKVAQ